MSTVPLTPGQPNLIDGQGYSTHKMRPDSWVAQHHKPPAYVKPLRVWLNHNHGEALQALPFELIWATAWEHEANEWIGPHLGLPDLPVITWPQGVSQGVGKLHWKTRTIVEYVAGRPLAWVDDEVCDLDRAYVNKRHGGSSLLHWVSPKDFEALRQ